MNNVTFCRSKFTVISDYSYYDDNFDTGIFFIKLVHITVVVLYVHSSVSHLKNFIRNNTA